MDCFRMEKLHISAIAFKEGDAWVAQGIEFDIAAHASDIVGAQDALMRAVVENICIAEHLGKVPMAGTKPAPERFKRMFDEATSEIRPLKPQDKADIVVRIAA